MVRSQVLGKGEKERGGEKENMIVEKVEVASERREGDRAMGQMRDERKREKLALAGRKEEGGREGDTAAPRRQSSRWRM